MSILSFFGCGRRKPPVYPSDTLTAHDGTEFVITFFGHASLAIDVGQRRIYVDPVGLSAQAARLPKADLILLTHSHNDHFDLPTVEKLRTSKTDILSDRTTAEAFGMEGHVMRPGSVAAPRDYVKIEAVAAYNTTKGHLQFHPKLREDCGYLLTVGGTRIYIAGDTEPTPEMKALRDVDIAFLPVNQPYTMTVEQAVEVIRTMKPLIFYPYHYGQVEEKTDLERLVREVEALDTTEIRIRPME
ncbi:MAG: MBL fold metallo-hydrolase [Alistipes sp.]|nr:MBL fold metallo-hydrolase [Alistipes senegalensis]MCM1250036.1 MBL fold metallo-hydrolase [Alistipes sp.]